MAAPVQRGTAHATFTAPTSTVGTIDADTFRILRDADQTTVKNESTEDILEVFSNPHFIFNFVMTLKAGQTPLKKGDIVELEFPSGHDLQGIATAVVISAEDGGFGTVIRSTISCKTNVANGATQIGGVS